MLNKTGAAYVEEAEFSSPLAGEAFTKPVGGLPYDRPAVHADPQQALEVVFYSLSQPNVVRKLLSVLSAGIPIDYIVAPFLSQIAGEGAVSPHTATLIAPAVTVMLARMAEAADIEYQISLDDDDLIEIGEDEINAARLAFNKPNKIDEATRINEISSKELVDKSKKTSIMQRPESLL